MTVLGFLRTSRAPLLPRMAETVNKSKQTLYQQSQYSICTCINPLKGKQIDPVGQWIKVDCTSSPVVFFTFTPWSAF